jgi:hypothetical protein
MPSIGSAIGAKLMGTPVVQAMPPVPVAPVTNPGQEVPAALDPSMQQLMLTIAHMASASLMLGMNGYELAQRVESRFGQMVYQQIVSTPRERLQSTLLSIPAAAAMLKPVEAALPAFIEEFYDYNTPVEEAETADDTQEKTQVA